MNEISVNGATQPHRPGSTVTDVVSALTARPGGCAVAINGAVVPRSDWSSRAVEPGDRIEVLTAVQGG
jgi:sulfur carrier protein